MNIVSKFSLENWVYPISQEQVYTDIPTCDVCNGEGWALATVEGFEEQVNIHCPQQRINGKHDAWTDNNPGSWAVRPVGQVVRVTVKYDSYSTHSQSNSKSYAVSPDAPNHYRVWAESDLFMLESEAAAEVKDRNEKVGR